MFILEYKIVLTQLMRIYFNKGELDYEREEKGIKRWLEFREKKLECGLSKEDKKHIYNFEKCTDMVLKCVDGGMYYFTKKNWTS